MPQSIFVFRSHDLNKPGRDKAGRAGADFLIPVAKDVQTLVGQSRLRHVRVVAADESAGFPGGPGPEMAALEDDDISHTALRELKCGRQAIDTAADHYDGGAAREVARAFAADDTVGISAAANRDLSRSSIQPPVPSCVVAS